MKTLHDALTWRYAIKKYDTTKKVSEADLQMLMEAAQYAPTSFGLQPFTIFHITNTETRKALRGAAWDQAQVTDASDFFVFAVPTNLSSKHVDEFMALTSQVQQVPLESLDGYKAMINGAIEGKKDDIIKKEWAARQAYIALGFLLEAAAVSGIDASPMEGFDPSAFDEILGLSAKNLTSVVMVSVGYRASDDAYVNRPKVRKSLETLFVTI